MKALSYVVVKNGEKEEQGEEREKLDGEVKKAPHE